MPVIYKFMKQNVKYEKLIEEIGHLKKNFSVFVVIPFESLFIHPPHKVLFSPYMPVQN